MAALVFLGALVVLAAWGMAALTMARSAGSPAARRVALLLFVLGADVATSIIGLLRVVPPREGWAVLVIHWMLDTAVPPLTLLFMARALDTPVARFLRRRPVEVALAGLALAGPAAAWIAVQRVPAAARVFVERPLVADGVDPALAFVPFLFAYVSFGFLLGFLLALHGWRGAEGADRRRAGLFAVAFGVLDVAWALAFGVSIFTRSEGITTFLQFVYGVGALVFALVLGYAILQHRLLGIDVKLRFAISKSTIAAVFIAVFFIASEAAQQFFGSTFNSAYLGILAAGALVFAIAPLSRLADRLAEKAVPTASPSAGPHASSAAETYRILVARMLKDDAIDRREERALAHAATSLGLTPQEALALRHEVEDTRTAGEVR